MAEELSQQISHLSLGGSDPPRFLSKQALNLSIRQAMHSIMVQRTHRSQSLRGLREFLIDKWELESTNSAVILNIIQFFLESDSQMTTIFKEEPWIYRGWLVTLDMEVNRDIPHFLEEFSVWVRVINLPAPFRNHPTLMDIGNFIGVSEDTKMEHTTRVGAADPKVRVRLNINNKIKPFQWVHFYEDEAPILVQFYYEKLKNYCNLCGSLLHTMFECSNGANTSSSSQPLDSPITPISPPPTRAPPQHTGPQAGDGSWARAYSPGILPTPRTGGIYRGILPTPSTGLGFSLPLGSHIPSIEPSSPSLIQTQLPTSPPSLQAILTAPPLRLSTITPPTAQVTAPPPHPIIHIEDSGDNFQTNTTGSAPPNITNLEATISKTPTNPVSLQATHLPMSAELPDSAKLTRKSKESTSKNRKSSSADSPRCVKARRGMSPNPTDDSLTDGRVEPHPPSQECCIGTAKGSGTP